MGAQSVRVNKGTEVLISPVVEDDMLDGPLYAINWFNLKRPWLYGIYAKLAYPHVVKAGAKVLFKGVVTDVLLANDVLNREQLLIVKYPSAKEFLTMLTSKLFLVKSILRIKSVADFTFGFCEREDNGAEPPSRVQRYSENKNYIVHLFTSNGNIKIDHLLSLLKFNQDIKLFYFGKTVAHVGRRDERGKTTFSPFSVDGLIVWEADEAERMRGLFATSEYEEFINSNSTNGVYTLKRVL